MPDHVIAVLAKQAANCASFMIMVYRQPFDPYHSNSIENYIQGDWRNVQRSKYAPNNWLNAALAGIDDGHNGGGPIWAIFDNE
jgi:hypothetical protein